jgi:hypothetical protein
MTTVPVPVLLLSGPVGAGKSSVGAEASRLLRAAGVGHALVDLAVLGQCWPAPADDPWNERLAHANLACAWATFRAAGAGRLQLAASADHVVDNDGRPIDQVAAEVLRVAGWAP